MDKDRELLIFGYSHEHEKKFDINVPIPISHLILKIYYDDYSFDKSQSAPDTKVMKKGKAITKIKCPGFGHRTSIFGESIYSDQCNKFEIVVRWNKCQSIFYFGWFTVQRFMSYQIIQKQPIGRYFNKDSSVGILIGNRYDEFTLYDKENTRGQILDYSADDLFKEGDTFGFVFDFPNDSLSIYHNGEHATNVSLNEKTGIAPAFSLGPTWGEEIEVIKCALS